MKNSFDLSGGGSGISTVSSFNPGNPYVGPLPFEGGPIYGRDREISAVLNLIQSERILLIHSASGAGKTSLIQSGVAPELERGGYDVLPVVRVGTLVKNIPGNFEDLSGNRYLASAVASLVEKQMLPEGTARAFYHQTLSQCLQALRAYRRTGDGMQLLIFDQFEEILSLDPIDTAEKTSFFADLALTLRDERIAAVFLLREDYLGELESYTRYLPTRLRSRFRLEPLTISQAIDAIRRPAEEHGVDFTPAAAEELTDNLAQVRRIAPDGTPSQGQGDYIEAVHLQIACHSIWERKRQQWANAEGMLTVDPGDVTRTGTVDEALAQYYADQVREAADASGIPEESIRDWVTERLITPNGLRTQVLEEGPATGELPSEAVHALERGLLLRREVRGGRIWFELSHDRFVAPIRADNAKWLAEDANWVRQEAEMWKARGQISEMLLTPKQLAIADSERKAHTRSRAEQQFLAASREKIKRRRNRMFSAFAVVSIIVCTAVVIIFVAGQKTARLSSYRSLARQQLDLQAELQARTYSEIPTEVPKENEIPWPRGKPDLVPSIAPSSRFGEQERATQQVLARQQLEALAATRAIAGITIRAENANILPAAGESLRRLGANLDFPAGKAQPPNSLAVTPQVPVDAVRATLVALAANGVQIARIRRTREENLPPGMTLEYVEDLEVWAPLSLDQINRLK